MGLFSEKLDHLQATVVRAAAHDARELAKAIDETRGCATVIGAGGSAITAAYLAACRRTLGHGPTWVTTPAEFVLTGDTAHGQPIWLLSGSGDNSDILAAFERARAMKAPHVHVLTSRADSELAARAPEAGASVHLADCGAEKDGFLATHTLAAALTALLVATDVAAAGATADPAPTNRAAAGRCRPVWAGRWPARVFVLALTSNETRPMWTEIADRLPTEIRRLELDGGGCGRFETAISVTSPSVRPQRAAASAMRPLTVARLAAICDDRFMFRVLWSKLPLYREAGMEMLPRAAQEAVGRRIGHGRTLSNAAQKRCGSVRLYCGLHEGSLRSKGCASASGVVGVFAGWRRFQIEGVRATCRAQGTVGFL